MKLGGKKEIYVLIGVLLSAAGYAASAERSEDSPYNAIIERNIFNLHPPPPLVRPEDMVKKTPPPDIKLTGITTIVGRKVAFLTIPPMKPGSPPESMMLAEGQAQNDIEVKSIDEKAGVVEVSNHGEIQPLDFDHNGVKPTGAPPPSGGPGPGNFPPPAPPVVPIPQQYPGNVVRPLRSLTRSTPLSENNAGGGANPSVGGSPFGGWGPANQMQNQSQAPQLSPEEQVALIELQRAHFQQQGDPTAKIFPHTEMTDEMNGQAPAAQ